MVDISDPRNVFLRNRTESLSDDTLFLEMSVLQIVWNVPLSARTRGVFASMSSSRWGAAIFFSFVLAKMARDPMSGIVCDDL